MQVSPATFHLFLNSKNFPITFVSIWSSKVSHSYFLGILNSLQLEPQEKRPNRFKRPNQTRNVYIATLRTGYINKGSSHCITTVTRGTLTCKYSYVTLYKTYYKLTFLSK